MKRFFDYELTEEENNKLEELLQDVPAFKEFEESQKIAMNHGLSDTDVSDEYERLYGDRIRESRDAATE